MGTIFMVHPALIILVLIALLAVALILQSATSSVVVAIACVVLLVGIFIVRSWYIGDLQQFRRH